MNCYYDTWSKGNMNERNKCYLQDKDPVFCKRSFTVTEECIHKLVANMFYHLTEQHSKTAVIDS